MELQGYQDRREPLVHRDHKVYIELLKFSRTVPLGPGSEALVRAASSSTTVTRTLNSPVLELGVGRRKGEEEGRGKEEGREEEEGRGEQERRWGGRT